MLGLTEDEAVAVLGYQSGESSPAGVITVPDGEVTTQVRVCGSCAEDAAGFPVALVIDGGTPPAIRPLN